MEVHAALRGAIVDDATQQSVDVLEVQNLPLGVLHRGLLRLLVEVAARGFEKAPAVARPLDGDCGVARVGPVPCGKAVHKCIDKYTHRTWVFNQAIA